jgi:demethylmenaquinone methyltransferase/2-methoxy-6-polyprenyl-1,4-benzoquinol methylase
VYAKAERQADLAHLRRIVAEYFRGSRILEVACGTGYWTAVLSSGATSVVATDAGTEGLEIARAKLLSSGTRVEFRQADAFALAGLGRGARVMLVDNRYLEGRSAPGACRDDAGNTYQRGRVPSGADYEVLKNFLTSEELRALLAVAGARSVRIAKLPDYWYATKPTAPTRQFRGRRGCGMRRTVDLS